MHVEILIAATISFAVMEVCLGQEELASCKSSVDCGDTECCVAMDKRMRRFLFSLSGNCRPRRYQGQACHVFITKDPFNPNFYLNYCPCEEGLECRGTIIDGANGPHAVHHDPKCLPIQATNTTVNP
ncbi:hypothetical protein CHS0354_002472 [Potamilus streckersoni]|uniref:Prokineticin domain-containing protein n=1 Tax=Potamilus streckersoni TaxID=2493646 RepID=A0AAE0WA35_9BIVA|nr:hypothetical protein CHS0354_002472 [Potamilus streckersoni]